MRKILFWESEGSRESGVIVIDTSAMQGSLRTKTENIADHDEVSYDLFEAIQHFHDEALVPGHIDQVVHVYSE